MGKVAGDPERMMFFSSFARALPWGLNRIKSVYDPFSGSFISRLPVTVAFLRLALKTAALFSTERGEDRGRGLDLLDICSRRLGGALKEAGGGGSRRYRKGRGRPGTSSLTPLTVSRKESGKGTPLPSGSG